MRDQFARIAYRIAYALLRVWWAIARPHASGVAVAVVHDGRVLVVEQSFRRGIGLPAGGRAAREDPERAARRELLEETGLAPPDGALVGEGVIDLAHEGRTLDVAIFRWDAPQRPTVRIDRREIIAFAWLTPDEIRARPERHPSLDRWLTTRAGQTRSLSPSEQDSPNAASPSSR